MMQHNLRYVVTESEFAHHFGYLKHTIRISYLKMGMKKCDERHNDADNSPVYVII